MSKITLLSLHLIHIQKSFSISHGVRKMQKVSHFKVYSKSQQVLDVKLFKRKSQIRKIIIWKFFVKGNRQIEGESARLSLNVNKLSRIFRCLILTYFLLNSYPKLVGTPCTLTCRPSSGCFSGFHEYNLRVSARCSSCCCCHLLLGLISTKVTGRGHCQWAKRWKKW